MINPVDVENLIEVYKGLHQEALQELEVARASVAHAAGALSALRALLNSVGQDAIDIQDLARVIGGEGATAEITPLGENNG